jgi:hypothetical protein
LQHGNGRCVALTPDLMPHKGKEVTLYLLRANPQRYSYPHSADMPGTLGTHTHTHTHTHMHTPRNAGDS